MLYLNLRHSCYPAHPELVSIYALLVFDNIILCLEMCLFANHSSYNAGIMLVLFFSTAT